MAEPLQISIPDWVRNLAGQLLSNEAVVRGLRQLFSQPQPGTPQARVQELRKQQDPARERQDLEREIQGRRLIAVPGNSTQRDFYQGLMPPPVRPGTSPDEIMVPAGGTRETPATIGSGGA